MPSWPWRALISGSPGSGKRSAVMNICAQLDHFPDEIIVVHVDPEGSGAREYAFADRVVSVDDCPTWDDIGGEPDKHGNAPRTLVVLDEIPWSGLKKDAVSRFERLLNFTSTHRNASVAIQAQQAMKVPPEIRRAANWLVMCGPIRERPELSGIALRIGIPQEDLQSLLGLMKNKHDSLWCDLTEEDPLKRWRLNGVVPIRHKDSKRDG